jgi:hypothetical protein
MNVTGLNVVTGIAGGGGAVLSGEMHAVRSRSMNSRADSCGLSGPCAQAPGNAFELPPLHVPFEPPWQVWLLPGQSLSDRQPLHVPLLQRSLPFAVPQFAFDAHVLGEQVPLEAPLHCLVPAVQLELLAQVAVEQCPDLLALVAPVHVPALIAEQSLSLVQPHVPSAELHWNFGSPQSADVLQDCAEHVP